MKLIDISNKQAIQVNTGCPIVSPEEYKDQDTFLVTTSTNRLGFDFNMIRNYLNNIEVLTTYDEFHIIPVFGKLWNYSLSTGKGLLPHVGYILGAKERYHSNDSFKAVAEGLLRYWKDYGESEGYGFILYDKVAYKKVYVDGKESGFVFFDHEEIFRSSGFYTLKEITNCLLKEGIDVDIEKLYNEND